MISKEKALERVHELRALEDGWDHPCNEKMTDACYNRAVSIINKHDDLIQHVTIGEGTTNCAMGVSIDYSYYPGSLVVNIDDKGEVDVVLSVISTTANVNVSDKELEFWVAFAIGTEQRARQRLLNEQTQRLEEMADNGQF